LVCINHIKQQINTDSERSANVLAIHCDNSIIELRALIRFEIIFIGPFVDLPVREITFNLIIFRFEDCLESWQCHILCITQKLRTDPQQKNSHHRNKYGNLHGEGQFEGLHPV
jgi:hypothetical protein